MAILTEDQINDIIDDNLQTNGAQEITAEKVRETLALIVSKIFDVESLQSATFKSLKGVGSLDTSTLVKVGMNVNWLGYNVEGDYGANDGIIVDAGSGSFEEGYFDLIGSGLQVKCLFTNGVNFVQFGADRAGVFDSYAAIQAAVGLGLPTYGPKGTYLVSQEVISNTLGQRVFGDGEGVTKLRGTSATGAVIRFKKAYSGIAFLTVDAAGDRAAATNSTGYGVQFEPDDVPRNPSTLEGYLYQSQIADIEITNQPSSGLYVAGGIFNGSTIDRFRFHSNRGHGFHIERGIGRTNPADAIGLCNMNHGIAFGNKGHGIAAGNPSDTTTTQTIRIQFNNVDTGNNALAAGVRFGAHQNWLSGTGLEWLDCYSSDSQATPTTAGLFIQGTNNHIKSIRTNDCFPAIEIGQNVAGLYTDGTYIDGINAIADDIADLDPAVVVHVNAKNTHVFTKNYGGIAKLVSANARGLSVGSDSVTFKKTSDQSVNNSTTLTGIEQFSYYATDDEEGYFELFLEFTSVEASHLKLDFTVPAGTQFRWTTSDARLLNTSGSIVEQLVLTSNSTTLSTFADTSRRSIFIKGFFKTTGTAGLIQPRFAQNAAVVGNTTIKTPTSYFRVNKITPLA